MRAVVYPEYSSDPAILEVRELPTPKVFPGSVLVEVRAAGVNPVDWKAMSGGLDALIDAVFPVIPGWDVAGVVVGLGMDTPEFQLGDEVIAYARKDVLRDGSFAEQMAIPVHMVARKPASLTWEQAAGLPLAGGTALRTLDALEVEAGQTLLVHAAAGGVGGFAVQIARARGARVIALPPNATTPTCANSARSRSLTARVWPIGSGNWLRTESMRWPTSSEVSSR